MANYLRGAGWTAAIIGTVVVAARLFFVDVWKIPEDNPRLGISVEPTLSAGDTVLMLTRGTPGFGALVRCQDPDDAKSFVVGRIAGVEDDIVEVQGADLTVNGKRYLSEMACAQANVTLVHPTSGDKVTLNCDQVDMGGHLHYRGRTSKYESPLPSKATVGHGKVFLLSDDRSYHDDSRDFGTVPQSTCNRRIFFRLWGKDGWGGEGRRFNFIH